MSAETLQGVQDAISAHFVDMNGEGAILTDWFIAYGGMVSNAEADDGISYPTGYSTSNSSPFGALGVAQMALESFLSDVTYGGEDDE